MDPITLMAIGAALGIGKNEAFDKPQAAKIRNYQASVAKFSPWTHMDPGSPTVAPSDFASGMQGGMTGLAIGAQLPKDNAAPATGPGSAAMGGPAQAAGGGGGMLPSGPTSTGSATGDYLGGAMGTNDYLGGAQPAPLPGAPGAPFQAQPPMAPRPFAANRRQLPTDGYPGYYPGQSPWMGVR